MRILIPEAQAMGSVACIRSLGRAGHAVIAMASNSDALGFDSRYCSKRVVQPPNLVGAAYADWLQRLLAEQAIDLILPTEGMVTALGAEQSRFVDRFPLGGGQRIDRFMSKFELFSHFEDAADPLLRENIPRTILMQDEDPAWRQALRQLECPVFAKFDAVPAKSLAANVTRFDDHADAERGIAELLGRYGRGIAQQFSSGQGVGVFFLRWDGEIRATLMHRRLHEVPYTGGVSSYRETWWNQSIHDDALRRIESMDWSGVGMLEYRWDRATGQFQLMEFNARFWGSLHLALFADVDFPRLLVDAWSGSRIAPVRARTGVRCRLTFPKEIEHLWSKWRDPDLEWRHKLSSLGEFFVLGLDPRIHTDLWFPGDRGLYWRALRETPGKFLRR